MGITFVGWSSYGIVDRLSSEYTYDESMSDDVVIEIIKNSDKLGLGGPCHQSKNFRCVPVFKIGGHYIAKAYSLRAWGRIMSLAVNSFFADHGVSISFDYVDFAWIDCYVSSNVNRTLNRIKEQPELMKRWDAGEIIPGYCYDALLYYDFMPFGLRQSDEIFVQAYNECTKAKYGTDNRLVDQITEIIPHISDVTKLNNEQVNTMLLSNPAFYKFKIVYELLQYMNDPTSDEHIPEYDAPTIKLTNIGNYIKHHLKFTFNDLVLFNADWDRFAHTHWTDQGNNRKSIIWNFLYRLLDTD